MFYKESLIKRYVFMGIDIVALTLALVLSNLIRFGAVDLFQYDKLYIHVYIIAVAACMIGNLAFRLDSHIFDRGYYQEFIAVVKSCVCIAVVVLTYLFMSQEGIHYSRAQLMYFFAIYFVLSYVGHQLLKPVIAGYYKRSRSCRKIMLITSSDKVEEILEKFALRNNWYFDLSYICIIDQDMQGKEIHGIPVVSNMENMLEVSKELVLDAVFINVPPYVHTFFDTQKCLHDFQSLGIIVHVNIDALELDVSDKVIDNLGFFKVVSYASRLRDPGQLVIKRLMDIAGALVGCVITILVGLVVAPAIYIESPGKVIFSQMRVGKNGRHFKMYKFRSMYPDADKRKAELMAQNEMKGAMFKMKDDPRITKVGKFIRKYSIDELPQFFNVLKGDMSLVGTRPPTVDEVEKYRVEQKRRLSVTPGMTGLWQTSGRNEVYDFDEIVKLDLKYIDTWSVGLDVKLLLKTIVVCVKGSGAE